MAAQFTDFRSGKRWRLLFWVLFFGLLLRIAYFTEHSRSAFFNVPLLDETFYDAAATQLLGGDDAPITSFRSLGYPAFLAVFYQLGGENGRILAILAQHLLGLATALLVAYLAFRLFGSVAAATLAATLYLLGGPPLYFEGELLAETLFTFEMTAVAALLVRCRPGDTEVSRLGPFLWAGFAIAVAAQTRPNALVALGALLGLAALAPAGRRLRPILAGTGATLAGLLFCALLQWPATNHFVFLPSQGGVNFYLGNKPGADGMIPRQSEAASYGDNYRDSVEVWSQDVFRREVGREPESPSELSRFWTKKTLAAIAEDPGHFLRLLLRKGVYLLANTEIPNNKSYAFALEQESGLLGLLPLRFFLLLGLAGAGTVLAVYRVRISPALPATTPPGETPAASVDRQALLGLALLATFLVLGVLAFFVNARFRLPLWPLLAALGGGVTLLGTLSPKPRVLAIGSGIGLALLSLLAPPKPEQLPGPGRDFFFRSLANFEKGDYTKALVDARRAVELEPRDAAARVQLGNVAYTLKKEEEAYRAFSEAVGLLPAEPRGFHKLGVVFERMGKHGDAYAAYLKAISLSRDYSPPYVQAALLELRAGLWEEAEAHLDQVPPSGRDTVPYLCARAFLLHGRGDIEGAKRHLEAAARRDPRMVEELAQESIQWLKFEDGLKKPG